MKLFLRGFSIILVLIGTIGAKSNYTAHLTMQESRYIGIGVSLIILVIGVLLYLLTKGKRGTH